MKILLTGASGFLGQAVTRALRPNHEIYVILRPKATWKERGVHALRMDLTELQRQRLPASVDAIIHLAQSRQFRKFPEQAQDIYKVNTDSTAQLLDYGRQAKIKLFVFASSGGVCGYQPRPILETDPPKLLNFYLASKYAGECLVNAYADHFVAVNLRYFFIYGEGQRDMFMPSLVGRVLDGSPVVIAGNSGVTMNPIYVSDAVAATVRALELQRSETINVAGPDVVSVLDLAEMIGQLTGRAPTYTREPDKGPLAMIADIEKMKLKLDLTPCVSIKEGVQWMVNDILGARGVTR
jgi:nucleoside-diphosphate-sugar epimerase